LSGFADASSEEWAKVKIKERRRDGIAILDVSGKLMGGPDAEAFNEILRTLMHEGVINFIVNLEKVKWVNSTGLGILISGYTTVKRAGGELKLMKVTERIENIFIVSKLSTVFQSYATEDEALRSFA
jgi:anti-sigma B factor antagonist